MSVLSDDEVMNLEAFLEAGGRVLVEGEFGRFDSEGLERENDLFARLRELYSDTLVRAPETISEYAQRRLRAEDPRADSDRKLIERLLDADPGQMTFRLTAYDLRTNLLIERAPLEDGRGWLFMVLPNAPTPEERAKLKPEVYSLEVRDGLRVEWLLPENPTGKFIRTRAGEPLCFRLVSIEDGPSED